MDSLFSLIMTAAVFIAVCSLISKKKKQQKEEEEARRKAKRFEEAGRRIGERISTFVQNADQETVKEVRNEVTREAEAWGRRSYSYKTPEEKKAARNALEDSGLQDEKHDWLARQLAEEQKAYREVSEMFEAKLSHLSSCAAENNRLDHVLRCDARQLAEETRNM